jgi:non-ribosomal peptide synthetase component F
LRVFAEQGLERASPGTAVSRFTFDQQLTTAVRELTVQRGTTLLMTLLTAYLVALSRWCDTNDLVVQVPTIARRHPEVQHAVGPFGTVLFLRVQLRQQESFIDLLARVVDEFNAAYEHDDAGAIPAATPSPPYASNPRFNFISQSLITSIQPTFDWSHVRGGDDSPITFERFDVKVPAGAQQEEPFLRMIDRRDELVGLLAYRTDRAKPETAKRFERSFRVVAEGMTQQPGGRISRWGQRA